MLSTQPRSKHLLGKSGTRSSLSGSGTSLLRTLQISYKRRFFQSGFSNPVESFIDLTLHTQPHKVNVTAPARSPVGKRRSITATVPDPDNPTSLPSCVRGSYYAIHVRGYAVLPGVDVRRHARSHPDRVIKLLSPNTGLLAEHGVTAAAAAAASTCRASPPPPPPSRVAAAEVRGGNVL